MLSPIPIQSWHHYTWPYSGGVRLHSLSFFVILAQGIVTVRITLFFGGTISLLAHFQLSQSTDNNCEGCFIDRRLIPQANTSIFSVLYAYAHAFEKTFQDLPFQDYAKTNTLNSGVSKSWTFKKKKRWVLLEGIAK